MEPTTGTPPPQPPFPTQPPGVPPKKKTSPLVWVLVGCLGLFVVGGIIFAAATFFVAKKVKDVAEDFAENPVRKSVETMVRLNPELELVSTDDQAETMTIRNTQTGEVATFDWSEIQSGQFRFETEDGSYTVDGSEVAEGRLTVEDGSGRQVAVFGSGEVPDWFPQYPDSTEVAVLVNAIQGGQESRIWTFQSGSSVADVVAFYDANLKGGGWEVKSTTSDLGQISNGSVEAKTDGGSRTLNLVATRSGGESTQVMVTYTGTG